MLVHQRVNSIISDLYHTIPQTSAQRQAKPPQAEQSPWARSTWPALRSAGAKSLPAIHGPSWCRGLEAKCHIQRLSLVDVA